jgi:hypothetical protein
MTLTTTKTGTLYMAVELGWDKWLMACATQAAEKPRVRSVPPYRATGPAACCWRTTPSPLFPMVPSYC